MIKQTLRDLLAKGKTAQVIEQLLTLTANDSDLNQQVTLLSAQFKDYERQTRMGLEDRETLNIQAARINKGLLEVITELDESGGSIPSVSKVTGASPTYSSPIQGSSLSMQKILWLGSGLVALIGILANLATVLDWLGIKPKEEGKLANVTVLVEDKDGEFVMRQQGKIVMMVEGGDVKQEDIDSKGAASFKNVKTGDKVRLKVDFSEPYRPLNPDSLYTIPDDGRIRLRVGLQNLGRIFGTVIYRDQPLEGVLVDVDGLRDTTDLTGRFEISIPENAQRKDPEVKFLKKGFKMTIKKAFPQTNEPLNIVMEK